MQKREIVLDTETTGLDPKSDRVLEIGCVELLDGIPTGRKYHQYINPQRSVNRLAARAIHGIDDAMLADKPTFAQVVDAFLAFIGNSPLVIHNAQFDLWMLNAELGRCGREPLDRSRVTCTLDLARQKYPGKANDLDALAKRLLGKRQRRDKHGALADALLLAEVYIGFQGGRQSAMAVDVEKQRRVLDGLRPCEWTPRLVQPSAEEAAAHRAFIATIPNAIWERLEAMA